MKKHLLLAVTLLTCLLPGAQAAAGDTSSDEAMQEFNRKVYSAQRNSDETSAQAAERHRKEAGVREGETAEQARARIVVTQPKQ
ncbi:hypothetical protein PQQ51_14045 [Paraburkholderia xenovorans]|uniref:hypothetical protein n=1 Tax=Paraburkholderia xenovorans TaxID=36873 RepID=UPI0038BA2B2F